MWFFYLKRIFGGTCMTFNALHLLIVAIPSPSLARLRQIVLIIMILPTNPEAPALFSLIVLLDGSIPRSLTVLLDDGPFLP